MGTTSRPDGAERPRKAERSLTLPGLRPPSVPVPSEPRPPIARNPSLPRKPGLNRTGESANGQKVALPLQKAPDPTRKVIAPTQKGASPIRKVPSPMQNVADLIQKAPSPIRMSGIPGRPAARPIPGFPFAMVSPGAVGGSAPSPPTAMPRPPRKRPLSNRNDRPVPACPKKNAFFACPVWPNFRK